MNRKSVIKGSSIIKKIVVSVAVIVIGIMIFEASVVLIAANASESKRLYLADNFLFKGINNVFFSDLPLHGKTVEFGSYPQTSEGESLPITWIVVSNNKDGTQTLVSESVLDIAPYDGNVIVQTAWSDCSLRVFLNDYFYGIAFTEKEKDQIAENQTVTKTRDWTWTTETDFSSDYVYIPGADDIKAMKNDLICVPTDYAKLKIDTNAGVPSYFDDASDAVFWWVRTPDFGHYRATCIVSQNGELVGKKAYDDIDHVPWDAGYVGIRPMINIKIS